jgi:hypothetical protein
MNRLACLHLTERSADILLPQHEIKDARDLLGAYLAMSTTKLTEYVNIPILLQSPYLILRQTRKPILKIHPLGLAEVRASSVHLLATHTQTHPAALLQDRVRGSRWKMGCRGHARHCTQISYSSFLSLSHFLSCNSRFAHSHSHPQQITTQR